MNSVLRDHQVRGIQLLRESLTTGHRRPLITMPTGAGKTIFAAAVTTVALRQGRRVAFALPALELVEQTARAFRREGVEDVGIVQANHPEANSDAAVQIASIATVARRGPPPVDVLVIDEAHVLTKAHVRWIDDVRSRDGTVIGLTATPYTRGLGRHFDDLLVPTSIAALVREKRLVAPRTYALARPDLSKVRIVAGDYHETELANAVDTHAIVGDVVREWIARADGLPTFAYGVNRAHARHLADAFAAAGVLSGYIDGETDRTERDEILGRFRNGAIKVIANVGVLTTGVDEDVRCVVLARPTRSAALLVQIVGRALRPASGKSFALVLDHTGSTLDLGRPTDIRCDRLHDGLSTTPITRAVPAVACPGCRLILRRSTPECPGCGFVTEAARAAWLGGLFAIARERRYSPQWALARYREKFGDVPPSRATRVESPSPEVRKFVAESVAQWRATLVA